MVHYLLNIFYSTHSLPPPALGTILGQQWLHNLGKATPLVPSVSCSVHGDKKLIVCAPVLKLIANPLTTEV